MTPPRRWHVLGAGSIGCLVAFHLRTAKYPVTLLVRRPPALYDNEKHANIRLTSFWGSKEGGTPNSGEEGSVQVDFEVLTPEISSGVNPNLPCEKQEPISRLLVTTKAWQAGDAVSRIQGRLGPDSVVVLLTNGWGVSEELSERFFPRERQVGFVVGTTTHGCYRRGPLDVVHAGRGKIWFGSFSPGNVAYSGGLSETNRVLEELSVALSALDVTSPVSEPELVQLMLTKLAVNACINPLTALFRIQNGELAVHPICRIALPGLAEEVVTALRDRAAAASDQLPLPLALRSAQDLLDQVETVATQTARNYSSMYQDLHSSSGVSKEKPPRVVTECEHILGKVIEMGAARRWMVWCRIIYFSVKAAEVAVNLCRSWTWLRSQFWRRIKE